MLRSFTRLKTISLLAVMMAMMASPSQRASAQRAPLTVDFFSGFDVNFRDISYMRQYDFYVCLKPAFKLNFGDHWQVAGQMYVDLVDQYDYAPYDIYYSHYGRTVYFGMLDISKEFRLGNVYFKASGGFFSDSRYGVDLKVLWPVADWLAFEAQGGCTGLFSTRDGWGFSPMQRFTGTIGGDIYLSRTNTQLRGIVGSYVFKDFGAEAEAIRHFRHSSVSLYANWNNKDSFNGGFRVVVMLPPYHRKQRVVNFRPASNYYFPYYILSHPWTNRMYATDPEENMRDGWFSRDFLGWGSHTMEPDYIITPKE